MTNYVWLSWTCYVWVDQLCMAVIVSMDQLCMDQLCMATAESNNGLAWYANFYQFHHLVGCHGIFGYCHDKRTI